MSALAEQIADERRRALRALLMKPLLTAEGGDAEALLLVRRHALWLREWLGRNCGWSLQVEAELARLRKTIGEASDDTRGVRDRSSGVPFSRRRYALLCLALAVLERSDRQTTLGQVAEGVRAAVAGNSAFARAGLTLDLDERDARRDLVHVVRLLLELRALVRVQGNEEHFVERRTGDVLYNVRRVVLSTLLAAQRGPSTVTAPSFEERLAALWEEPQPEGDEGRNRRLRTRLTRRLLDDPVLYFDELTDEERAYLTSQRAHILRQIEEATGLVPEVRREGIALVDPEGELSDLGMPEEGTEGHVALLVAEFLAGTLRARAGEEGAPVPLAAIAAHVAELRERHRKHWRKDALVPGSERTLAAEALARLEALRLVRRSDLGVIPRPALARYRLLEPSVRKKSTARAASQGALFE